MKSHMSRQKSCLLVLIAVATCAQGLHADPEAIRFFETKIRPVLAENCYKCHGEKKQKGGLRLDNLGYILVGGELGPSLVAGNPADSHLFKAVGYTDPDFEMPPDGKLPDDQIADIKRWIEMGAPWPAEEVIAARKPGEFTAEERGWWSFQPLKNVMPPDVSTGKAVVRNDVDRFVVAKLHDAGLEQAPEAEARELVRRLYYNLHGLPPNEEQINSYLNDTRPDAWQRLVDELLDSPRYGMRWGQHWLDLVRYAESDGYRADAYRPDAWPYRDYVIRSFNEDKPYNQFVREQLAGDEINPGDPNILIGTAFLRHGIYEWNQADAEQQRDIMVKEFAGLTGEVFLGLSIGCAECHDHKFDPILQRDYYRMKSFFEPMLWRDDIPLAKKEEIQTHAKAMAAWEAESASARTAWEIDKQAKVDDGTRKALAYFPPAVQEMKQKPAGQLTPYEKQVVYLVDRRVKVEVDRAVEGFKPKSSAWSVYKPFEERKPKPLQRAFVATDVGTVAPPTKMKTRRGESVVEPGFLTILAPGDLKIEPLSNIGSTGRRTALADWITDPANPLATRVIVNRVWQYHFGRGLSGIASDFGRLGEAPSHPELLDWLTAGFIEHNWSFKWLHRQILNSATYRQSSLVKATPRANEIDPENRLLWRARPQRLDAEQMRDTLLALSGELKPLTGGPSEDGSKPVPSILVKKQRNAPDEFLSRFDAPPGFQSVAKRDATNTALQSLLMVNGEWPMQRARAMAVEMLDKYPTASREEIASSAVAKVFGRPARDDERASGAGFLAHDEKIIANSLPKEMTPVESSPALVDGSQMFPGFATAVEPTLSFHPGGDHEKIVVQSSPQEELAFSIEAVVWLDSLYQDTSVRTIASRWNGKQTDAGWSLGITGRKSKLSAGQLVMQLGGRDFQDTLVIEVVESGLKIPVKKPFYIAAVVSSEALPGQAFGGNIRFFTKDLSDPLAVLKETRVAHAIGDGYVNPERALMVGGRDGQQGHLWSGGIHRLTISNGLVSPEAILSAKQSRTPGTVISLDGNSLASTDNSRFEWVTPPRPPVVGNPAKLEALADLFHILINSNEFLYQP
jgi:hypothetical protein